jgi:hypothetical protein
MQVLTYTGGMKQVQHDNQRYEVLKLRNADYYVQDKRWEKYPA